MTKIWEPLKLEYIGHAVIVNGALLREDMYQMDMLNRALADLCNANADYRVRQLMAWMHSDTLVRMMVPSTERVPVVTLKERYEHCLAAADPIAGFALLRSASMVNMLVEMVYRYCGSEDGEKAREMVKTHLPSMLKVKWHEGLPMGYTRVDDLTMAQIEELALPKTGSFEARSMWYALAQDLLPVAASLLADCLLIDNLYHLFEERLTGDGRWHAKNEVEFTYTTWRRDLLARQMQATLVKMTGSVFAQQGMNREDAEDLLKYKETLTAVA